VTFTGTYMLTNNIGLELLAALPFEHDIELNGSKVGETKQLPPTLSVQWHFPIGQFKPYVGVGVNYTIFFDQSTTGALDGADLDLDNSLGLAGQAGVDWFINDNWLINFDVRYISIETDAKVNGDKLGTVDINPWIVGLNAGYKF
jgi:outer membrane protein